QGPEGPPRAGHLRPPRQQRRGQDVVVDLRGRRRLRQRGGPDDGVLRRRDRPRRRLRGPQRRIAGRLPLELHPGRPRQQVRDRHRARQGRPVEGRPHRLQQRRPGRRRRAHLPHPALADADSGHTWAQAGVNLPPQFLGLTVDTAPSNPQRVYISGRNGPPSYPGVIARSDDRGATWQMLSIPGADSTHLPYIGAVDPQNPDIVYVRLDADPSDSLLVSKDGGVTWTTAYTATGKLTGFALSPDGTN